MPNKAKPLDADQPAEAEVLRNVQGELPEIYSETLGVLSARKRRPRRLLLQDALDLLFAQHAATINPNSASSAGSTLKGA